MSLMAMQIEREAMEREAMERENTFNAAARHCKIGKVRWWEAMTTEEYPADFARDPRAPSLRSPIGYFRKPIPEYAGF